MGCDMAYVSSTHGLWYVLCQYQKWVAIWFMSVPHMVCYIAYASTTYAIFIITISPAHFGNLLFTILKILKWDVCGNIFAENVYRYVIIFSATYFLLP